MRLFRIVIALYFFGFCSPLGSFCQSAKVAMPQDAGALMRLVHDKNGLTGSDIKPWHMRGTYHSYKEGKVEYQGQYEEWWFSPTQYKLTFSNPNFTQTDYANGTTLLRDGKQEWLTGPELLLRASLVDPLPDAGLLANFKLKRGSRAVGKANLDCVTLTYKTRAGLDLGRFPSACFEPTMPVLRMFDGGFGPVIMYDHIVFVQGHYVAHQVQISIGGGLVADLNTESIEELHSPPEAIIAPPASAVPVDLPHIAINNDGNPLWPMPLIRAYPDLELLESGGPSANTIPVINPDLPPEARAGINLPKFAQGTVVVKVRVSPDGRVEDAEFISGSIPMQKSSIEAARQWVFRPFTVMGEARSVETELSFTISVR